MSNGLETKSVIVCYKDQKLKLPLIVVKGDGPSLLSRNWLLMTLEGLLQKYKVFFSEELGPARHNGRSAGN